MTINPASPHLLYNGDRSSIAIITATGKETRTERLRHRDVCIKGDVSWEQAGETE